MSVVGNNHNDKNTCLRTNEWQSDVQCKQWKYKVGPIWSKFMVNGGCQPAAVIC